jgi:hypothetical protein
MKEYGGMDAQIHVFLTSASDGDEWPASRSSCFTTRNKSRSTHLIEGLVDPRAFLYDKEK